VLADPRAALDAALATLGAPADVVVTFPPDGRTDGLLAPACVGARRVVYVSSTGVHGNGSGCVDERSPVDRSEPRARLRLDAESAWRTVGAVVLRAPAIYGPWRGMHARLREGKARLVESGTGRVSLVHVDDLVTFVLAALERAARASTYVVGDLEPSPQRAIMAWLCERLGLPLPPSIDRAHAAPTLRADRAVIATRALGDLGVTLAYPTFREGFAAALSEEGR